MKKIVKFWNCIIGADPNEVLLVIFGVAVLALVLNRLVPHFITVETLIEVFKVLGALIVLGFLAGIYRKVKG